MATLVFQAVGAAAGSALLPGGVAALGLSGAAIGGAVGAAGGGLLDQRLFGQTRTTEGARLSALEPPSAQESAPIPRVFGRARPRTQLIWATRFKEHARTTTQEAGGKGGGGASTRHTEYSYTASFAIGLCEGPIAGIGRIWADGDPMPLEGVSWRLHPGGEDQQPDPLIAAMQPDAPAFRGLAYLVFEDLPLARYNNRIPAISVEAIRPPSPPAGLEDGPDLRTLVRGVSMAPGTGEFALAPQPVRRVLGEGASIHENLNNTQGVPDLLASLDALETSLPACRSVLLVVSWFGDDLRCGRCALRPGVDRLDKSTEPLIWSVLGLERAEAHLISTDPQGAANYGGTPSDLSVFETIRELKARGFAVIFYPFILMDVPPGNSLPNPYSDNAAETGQPAFPWRGRITLDVAPGAPGSSDGSAAAADEVAAFFGAAQPEHFHWTGAGMAYSGPAESSFRRMILHYAALCAAAGGVDAFCIGSEMRGLTTIRSGVGAYPAVQAFRDLAAGARALLGESVRLGYAADWSEYSGHRPDDGSGDVFFHLDPLWADADIDFIGIDNYMPLSDWRPGRDHLDAQAGWPAVHDLDYLKSNIEGGEYGDWFYASPADRDAQRRSPIQDTAHGEDWVFAVKRLRDWWENPHHDRPGGVRSSTPTAWVPRSKPIWFTELGCPAVDLGTNQPNVFYDPKSSESALPHYSRGVRDDMIQRRYLQAMLAHWAEGGPNNPVSPLYGGPMIDMARAHVWTWDARPYPDFPLRVSVWRDAENYRLGHWISGRADSASLAAVAAELCARGGEARVDVSRLHDLVDGYVIAGVQSARRALEPLMKVFGFDAVESGGVLRFVPRAAAPVATLSPEDLVVDGDGADPSEPYALTREQETDLPRAVRLAYTRSDAEYRAGAAEATLEPTVSRRVETLTPGVALSSGRADAVVRRWLAESWIARDRASFLLPPSRLALEPTDVVALAIGGRALRLRVTDAADDAARAIEAVRVAPEAYACVEGAESPLEPPPPAAAVPALAVFLDLPLLDGSETPHAPHVAAFSAPWSGVSVYRSTLGASYELAATLTTPATLGRTLTELAPSAPSRWSHATVDVALAGGALLSRERLETLGGANAAALETPEGWEVVQFREATLIGSGAYRLGGLLRGQAGTEHLIRDPLPAGARFVLIDGALSQLAISESDRGLPRFWRYGPNGVSYEAETYRTEERAFSGVGLRPYAPAHLRAERDAASGDIRLAWIRRARLGGDQWEREPPLGEEREEYRVELRAGGTLLRSATVPTPNFTYAAAQQAEDSAVGPVTAHVAQISARWGAGPERSVTLP